METFLPELRRRVWHLPGTTAACILLKRGEGTLSVGETIRPMPAGSLAWLSRSNPASFEVSAGAQGVIAQIPAPVLDRSMPFGPFAGEVRKATRQNQLHEQMDKEQFGSLVQSMETLCLEVRHQQPGAREVIDSHISLITIALWRMMREHDQEKASEPAGNLAQRFRAEIDMRLRDHPTIAEIADTLGVTRDRLNRAVFNAFEMTPKQLIHSRQMAEACRLLLDSNLQTDEIAVLLGFSDPAYFNRFFRQRAGLPPGRFRKANKGSRQPDTSDSFASWP